MKIGDKVRIKTGKHTGKIGVVKTIQDRSPYDTCDVEIPDTDRWHFFVVTEVEVIPPSPAENVDRMIRVAAGRVVDCWKQGLNIEPALQTLEKALLN